ncbi:MAG: circadian clock KaiB family protein [Oscillatoria sp. PMC 1068.18]|nr:circadian clock KaiB family protein [Oscillatoria sp. PMC 1076.18]MEC4987185.1 circadian clock KaiB family protein [Oscillatoria sp. PMC 1068.18]
MQLPNSSQHLFKGIALFTPGGDLVYCIDPSKQGRWHLNLCVELQNLLGLPEPPHFLVPGYTATVDRWFDAETQQVKILAEIYPPVQRYQTLLNAVFATEKLVWQVAPWQDVSCSPMVLETYKEQFPQLWESQDLIVRLDESNQVSLTESLQLSQTQNPKFSGYVLRLFVSGQNAPTQRTLESLHHVLEQGLGYPYTLTVIDIFKHPEQAEINQVSATPTLVRVFPEPVRKIVGELNDLSRVLQILTNA